MLSPILFILFIKTHPKYSKKVLVARHTHIQIRSTVNKTCVKNSKNNKSEEFQATTNFQYYPWLDDTRDSFYEHDLRYGVVFDKYIHTNNLPFALHRQVEATRIKSHIWKCSVHINHEQDKVSQSDSSVDILTCLGKLTRNQYNRNETSLSKHSLYKNSTQAVSKIRILYGTSQAY